MDNDPLTWVRRQMAIDQQARERALVAARANIERARREMALVAERGHSRPPNRRGGRRGDDPGDPLPAPVAPKSPQGLSGGAVAPIE